MLPNHPTNERLRVFALGQLKDQEWAEVEQHLATCQACARRIQRMAASNNEFPDALKRAQTQDSDSIEVFSISEPTQVSDTKDDLNNPLSMQAATIDAVGNERADDIVTCDGISITMDQNPKIEQKSPLPRADEFPHSIGPFKILQPIGRGGMGQVYMAEQQQPLRRRVALKVIKTDTPTKEILGRFEAERQALAMMDHQNIAKVLDAGITEDGRPYFAMELVKGVPITEYCDKNKLTPNERLELFVQICRAIQHAHMKGIVHRDIKPSNVLVTLYDGRPVAKVIDFGLAKALQDTTQLTNRTLFTRYGQVVGTLAYMSPEQAEMNSLDVDTRTDVYSLGVILFELLTGSTPITSEKIRFEAFDRILALIREEEAPRPSQRLSDSGDQITGISDQRKTEPRRLSLILKGELDWIAVKALEKDRTRRYDTPAALADDVERYLKDEAIEARPPSFGYRFQKAIRKHRASFLSAASILGLLVAGLIGTGTMWIRAAIAEKAAVTAARNARTAEAIAHEAEAKERDASKELEKRAAELSALNAELTSQVIRMKVLASLANDYQVAILDALALLEPGQVFAVSQREAAFVGWDKHRIVLRISGRNTSVPIAIGKLPLGIAFGIADLKLDNASPQSLAMKASYAFFRGASDQSTNSIKPQIVEWMAIAERSECVPSGTTQMLIDNFELNNEPEVVESVQQILASEDLEALKFVAWSLVTTSDKDGSYPQAKRAVRLARRACELLPSDGKVENILGIALYRSDNWREAIEALQQSIHHGTDMPHNWLFIAMSYWQLDQKDKAREWYDKSLAWQIAAAASADANLQGFFAEAARLMTVDSEEEPKTDGEGEPAYSAQEKAARPDTPKSDSPPVKVNGQ